MGLPHLAPWVCRRQLKALIAATSRLKRSDSRLSSAIRQRTRPISSPTRAQRSKLLTGSPRSSRPTPMRRTSLIAWPLRELQVRPPLRRPASSANSQKSALHRNKSSMKSSAFQLKSQHGLATSKTQSTSSSRKLSSLTRPYLMRLLLCRPSKIIATPS